MKYALFMGSLLLTGCSPDGSAPATTEGQPLKEQGIRIVVYDETQSKPLHAECELRAGGLGRWRIKQHMVEGMAEGFIMPPPPFMEGEVLLFPDSTAGREIRIPFFMTRDMNSSDPEAALVIEIRDEEIVATGAAVAAVGGEGTLTFARF